MPSSSTSAELALRVLQGMLLGGGFALLLLSMVTLAAGELGRRADVGKFSTEAASEAAWQAHTPPPDMSLWSTRRVRDFKHAETEIVSAPVAVLRVPTLALTVPIYSSTAEVHLNRGVGVIDGMALPDHGGNLGLAGHRDGFFRVLKDIEPGTVLEVETRRRVHRYRVSSIDIVDKADSRLLVDTDDPTITLVTCYPFYFVGDAPRRFIVRGEYLWQASSVTTSL